MRLEFTDFGGVLTGKVVTMSDPPIVSTCVLLELDVELEIEV